MKTTHAHGAPNERRRFVSTTGPTLVAVPAAGAAAGLVAACAGVSVIAASAPIVVGGSSKPRIEMAMTATPPIAMA